MRLIDADMLTFYVRQHWEELYPKDGAMIDAILVAKAIEAEPVRHGHWIFKPKDAIEMMFTLPKCSECGAESSDGGNYCHNCGAKMDEAEE